MNTEEIFFECTSRLWQRVNWEMFVPPAATFCALQIFIWDEGLKKYRTETSEEATKREEENRQAYDKAEKIDCWRCIGTQIIYENGNGYCDTCGLGIKRVIPAEFQFHPQVMNTLLKPNIMQHP